MRRMHTDKQIEDIAKGVAPTDEEIQEAIADVESGTLASVIGLDSEGKLVKGTISGGTQLYRHTFEIVGNGWQIEVISSSNSEFKDESGKLKNSAIKSALIISISRNEDPSGDYVIHGIPGPSYTYYLALRTLDQGAYSYSDLTISTEVITSL